MQQPPSQPRAYSQAYMPNGAPSGVPAPGATPLLPNQGRVIQSNGARVLCIADVRGNLRSLNDLARQAKADHIIHTGDFGFYDDTSLNRIAEKTLKHVAQYSPLLTETTKADIARAPPQTSIKERFHRDRLPLSELPQFLSGQFKLEVPVYTVWGACEDVSVLEKLRSGDYNVPNLHIIDEAHSRLLDVGGVKLRLLGLGGAVVMHKLFDNGEGRTTIAGGQGTMWTTLLQIGELVDTANRVYDPTETRVFVTHASPAREGLLNQLSVALKADFSISAGLHFRYGSSYNEFSVNPTLDHYRGKLAASKASFNDVWETVKSEVEPAVADNESQQRLLQLAIEIVTKMPSVANGGNPFGGGFGGPASGQVDESAFKNMWNFNLADAAFGWLVLDIDQGRIGTEMRAQGFNFSHRGTKTPQRPGQQAAAPSSTAGPTTATNSNAATPAPVPAASPAQAQPRAQPPQQPAKPIVPVPQQTKSPAPQRAVTPQLPAANGAKADEKPNGTAAADPKSAPIPQEAPKPSQAIFIPPIAGDKNEESEVRQIFTEEDGKKINKLEKTSKGFWIAHFDSPEIMQEVLQRSPHKDSKYSNLRISEFRVQRSAGARGGHHGGAGTWGSSRGGAQAGAREGGYRSGGERASDSDSGRGRGRGGYRGRGESGRGRGRGARGSGTPQPGSTPAPAGGDA
ncbi:hypothetical protein AAFC00_004298 [Neodothiora populina]|uniref:DUF2433 domain-containing protein n=1 Tax=Neodothiora populina TaxID=2781224 RepID=A0ABR3PJ85_9PEZI